MWRALVSGISGHLGHELARQLVAADVEVHGLTRQNLRSDHTWSHSVQLHRVDGETESLIGIVREIRPHVVFHLASLYRREHQSADVTPLVNANILFGTQLLEAMRMADCSRIVTAATYFQHYETDAYRALNLYAATKQAFEDILAYYVDAFEFSAISLYQYEIYSEADTRPKLMRAVANAWADRVPLNLPSEEFWVDFVHVEDAAAAFVHAASLLEGETVRKGELARYSVCSGQDVSADELVALFGRLSGRKLAVNRGEFPQPKRRMQKPWRGPVLPGWTPHVSLEDGVSRILARWR